MDWKKKYQEWCNCHNLDSNLQAELASIADTKELEDRFYRYLAFGTGGMRGQLGVGTNRMNRYSILRAALGLARYTLRQEKMSANRGVVISFDNRHFSQEFAQLTAQVLASQQIKVYLSDCLRPTPELSFLVRHYQAFAGVMITASHNPKEYNGFKIYGADGGQITLETANALQAILNEIDNELTIHTDTLSSYLANGMIQLFSSEADVAYLAELRQVVQNQQQVQEAGAQLQILYTPLHGTGRELMTQAFAQVGFSNVQLVNEQSCPDPDFTTVASPNPEDPQAFKLALQLAKEKPVDLILATDPDADRLGVVVIKEGEPVFLTGNQIGVLLLDYLIQEKELQGENLNNYFMAKTIVTSDLGEKLAAAHQLEVRNTLTGFKFIGEQIKRAEQPNQKQFLFGYEESFGYLVNGFVRDKDAIQAAVLLAETTLASHLIGESLLDRLEKIYQQYGFYQEDLETATFPGKDGQEAMQEFLERLRENLPKMFAGNLVTAIEDYATSISFLPVENREIMLTLPKSNVLKFILEDGSWLCIRPSGTEPKLKTYYSVNGKNPLQADEKMTQLKQAFHQLMQPFTL